ncbi:MAG TPA: DMT family transporter [Acidiphilium sp.]
MTALLFSIVVLAWGLTWYAIHLELGPVPTEVSIFWRIFLAAMLLWVWLVATGRWRRARFRQHVWFAALGLTLFCANFLFLYEAETCVPSGIVAVVFSMATVFNALNQWLFRGIRPSVRVLAGAGLGTAGVALLFADHLTSIGADAATAMGIALALAGTFCFSAGNLVSRRAIGEGTTLPNALVRGMAWGSAFLAIVVIGGGHGFVPGLSISYLAALLYLAGIGSVVGFLAYLSLISRIGPERAAYVTVLSPVIALGVSTLLEGYVWTAAAVIGLPLILLGNVVIFAPALRRLAGSPAS